MILLSVPVEVLLERLRTRMNNPYGKTPSQQSEILEYVRVVEPLLRLGADMELDGRVAVAKLAAAVQELSGVEK